MIKDIQIITFQLPGLYITKYNSKKEQLHVHYIL